MTVLIPDVPAAYLSPGRTDAGDRPLIGKQRLEVLSKSGAGVRVLQTIGNSRLQIPQLAAAVVTDTFERIGVDRCVV